MEEEEEESVDIVYEVGDVGPAGGIVFLDKGEESDGWRYMEIGLGEFNLERLYWTSSEFNESGAMMVNFAESPGEGHFGIGGKNFGGVISVTRPVRYF